jgi:hypothetical protein
MTEHAKITRGHLARQAIVHLRQSSTAQVEHNRESTDRQYALAHKAHELGWSDDRIVVIDEVSDFLGPVRLSARLTAEVALGHVGIVLGLEVSRLARNSASPDRSCWPQRYVDRRRGPSKPPSLDKEGNTRVCPAYPAELAHTPGWCRVAIAGTRTSPACNVFCPKRRWDLPFSSGPLLHRSATGRRNSCDRLRFSRFQGIVDKTAAVYASSTRCGDAFPLLLNGCSVIRPRPST